MFAILIKYLTFATSSKGEGWKWGTSFKPNTKALVENEGEGLAKVIFILWFDLK